MKIIENTLSEMSLLQPINYIVETTSGLGSISDTETFFRNKKSLGMGRKSSTKQNLDTFSKATLSKKTPIEILWDVETSERELL